MDTGFYTSAAWRHTREAVLERDNRACQASRLLGGACSSDLHAHHLVPAAVCDDPLDQDNLVTVCGAHHRALDQARRVVSRGRANASAYRRFSEAA